MVEYFRLLFFGLRRPPFARTGKLFASGYLVLTKIPGAYMGYGHSGVGNIKLKMYFVGKCQFSSSGTSIVCLSPTLISSQNHTGNFYSAVSPRQG